jgi:dihydropyrimidinase
MKLDYIIQNGTVVTDEDIYVADIGIAAEKIAVIKQNLTCKDAELIDATGKYIFPGGIDVHTHLDLPVCGTVSKDDFATGTIAAACGGTTSIIDFCTQYRGESLTQALENWHAKSQDKAVVDYGFHLAITEVTDAILAEMQQMVQEGCPSFKLYMTYAELRVTDDELLRVLMQAKDCGGLVCVHAENHHMLSYLYNKFKKEGKNAPIFHALSRPTIAESEAVGRAIKLAMFADAPLYIVHLTCKAALDEVIRARTACGKIMAETCPQYLLLSADNYKTSDFTAAKYVLSPPLRTQDNQEFLWQGLADNSLQVVSTDHCSFDFVGQKNMGRDFFGKIPNGLPSIEARMALIFDRGVNAGRISLNKFVAITATNPAKIFGMYPQKGAITVGADADLVIFDPQKILTITHALLHENVDYTPYEGFNVKGYPVMTLSRGEIIVKDGKFVGKLGRGKFIKRRNPMII